MEGHFANPLAPRGPTERGKVRCSLARSARPSNLPADTVIAVGSTATDWVTLLFTTLGGGVSGLCCRHIRSPDRERRQARTEARNAVKTAEKAVSLEDDEELDAALEDLATKAMLAGLPRFLVDLYSESKHLTYGTFVREQKKQKRKA